jgi:hypothetical protein
MGSRIDDKTAEAIMIAAGWKPLVKYPLADKPWKSQCMTCGNIAYPIYIHVKRGSGCRACKNANRVVPNKISNEEAIKRFLDSGFKAIEKVKYGKRNVWKTECLKCGIIVNKRLDALKANKKCQNCYWINKIMPEEEALQILSDANLKPLEAYIKAKKWWKVECLKCSSEISVMASNIKNGSGCPNCAKNGFNVNDEAYIYLITNKKLNSHKIGIANSNNRHDRLDYFQKKGWEKYHVWNFKTGSEASKIESSVFKIIRKDMKIPVYLNKQVMGLTGSSETMSADLITLKKLKNMVDEACLRHRETVKG